ncbi:MAG: MFS transporter [Gammaproteobacteria bacterium]|nr:MFS transporter [Gammaproteobacteria bacterium]
MTSSAPSGSHAPLPRRLLFAFGFVSVPLATGGLPLVLYLTPYYAAASNMSLALIGAILAATRLADVLVDPLVGALSDRTPARYGRRGLWIAAGVPVMAGATLATFAPPSAAPGPAWLFWATGALYLGWSLITIPLNAWVAELSGDYHERSRLAGARAWGSVVGALLAILAPLVLATLAAAGVAAAAPTAPGSLQPMLTVLAWLTVALLLVSVPWLLRAVPQPAFADGAAPALLPGLGLIFANRAFRRLLLANIAAAIGWNSVNVLFMFFVTRCLGANEQQWPLVVLAYFVGQLLGTPLIVRLAPRFSKHRMLAVCSLVSIALFSGVLLLERGDYLWYAALNLVNGLLAPSINILGPSMAADVIDEDHLASGVQRGALFMALWAMTEKLAVALAAVLALGAAEAMGFDPAREDPASLLALKISFCAVPNLFFLLSVACIWRYPLDSARLAEIRAALRVRESRRLATMPAQGS